MIQTKYYRTRKDGVKLFITTTDKGEYYLRQIPTGILYFEPVDVEGAPYTYEETDIPLEKEEEVQ